MPWALTCCVASQLSGSASTCATTSRASVSLGRSNHTASTAKLASTTLAASAHWRQADGGLPERRGAMSGGRSSARRIWASRERISSRNLAQAAHVARCSSSAGVVAPGSAPMSSPASSQGTMVSSQGRAAPGSFNASRDRHARSSASCTMSSAIERSRASQWAKRSSSGRIDSSSRVMGASASAAGTPPPIEETGDPGSELRMSAAVPEERRLYARTPAAPAISRQSARSSRPTVAEPETGAPVKSLVQWLINWPRQVAAHLGWLAPLFARITGGWVFVWSGWGKLTTLPQVTENFIGWGIPLPHLLAPFVSGVEFFGGLFLLLGLLTRISAGALSGPLILSHPPAEMARIAFLTSVLGVHQI